MFRDQKLQIQWITVIEWENVKPLAIVLFFQQFFIPIVQNILFFAFSIWEKIHFNVLIGENLSNISIGQKSAAYFLGFKNHLKLASGSK